MCLAVPLKLIEIDGVNAVGESLGLRRQIRVDFIDRPKLGDYVIVHAGFAIERLPEEQALEDLETWEEIAEDLDLGVRAVQSVHGAGLVQLEERLAKGDTNEVHAPCVSAVRD